MDWLKQKVEATLSTSYNGKTSPISLKSLKNDEDEDDAVSFSLPTDKNRPSKIRRYTTKGDEVSYLITRRSNEVECKCASASTSCKLRN